MIAISDTALANQRCKTQVKTFSEEEKNRRNRDFLLLCINQLEYLGYHSSAQYVANETGIGTDRFELCDNMSFMKVLVDFETLFEQKYGIRPKISKSIPKGSKKHATNTSFPSGLDSIYQKSLPEENKKETKTKKQNSEPKSPRNANVEEKGSLNDLSINAKPISAHDMLQNEKKNKKHVEIKVEQPEMPVELKLIDRVPPQLRDFYGDLTGVIAREIFTERTGVKWEDIVGLNNAKRVLREAVVMPLKFPRLFQEKKLLTPWKGVLLHGPPGTGKTLLAKAVASEGTTFFNISASTIVSKWRGDSEKLIRVLFDLARYHAPSTIFIDEMDSIMSKRSSQGEHEASRRMKTEILMQMDGLFQTKENVFVLAASNFPFDLDPALLRRLEKRILVPLPEEEARLCMFKTFLTPDIASDDIDFNYLASKTEGYSGSDIRLICKEAAMEPLRRLMDSLQQKYGDKYLDDANEKDICLGLISNYDVNIALNRTKSSAMYKMEEYEKWQEQYGVE